MSEKGIQAYYSKYYEEAARKLQEVTEILLERYKGHPASSLKEVLNDNKDIGTSYINQWASIVFKTTAKPYLVSKGIIVEEPAEKIPADEKLNECIEKIRAAFTDRKATSLRDVEERVPSIRSAANLNNLTRSVYGKTASEFLIEIGILEDKAKKLTFSEKAKALWESMKSLDSYVEESEELEEVGIDLDEDMEAEEENIEEKDIKPAKVVETSSQQAEGGIQVGKYTLESLTTGMYSDPKIIYREYIQNSVDSLENAVSANLIEPQSIRIDIVVDSDSGYISIRDNGTGIRQSEAVSTLMNIGSSKKRHSNNRGFRGIGRLGGMSYCDRLIFTTSAENESVLTKVTFDCKKLRQLLVPGAYEEMDLANVLQNVTSVEIKAEKPEKHYFLVEMVDVAGFTELLKMDTVKSYISQVAPVPYKTRQFVYANELRQFLQQNGYTIEEFPIFVGESMKDLEPIYKPNRHRFLSDRNKKKNDEIVKMNHFKVDVEGDLYALGWYGSCNWYGSLSDSDISGIRVRKGNILIGDNRTLNVIFKEPRFNGWVQGELFIVTDKLIPNARRDDFEQNEAYYKLIQALQDNIGTEITKKIRIASQQRNDTSAKVINEIQEQINNATLTLEEGFNSSVDKTRLIDALEQAGETLEKTKVRDDLKFQKKKLKEKLDQTIETVSGSKNYKLNQVHSGIDRKGKKILEVVSDILSEKLSKQLVNEILEEIVTALNRK